MNTASGTQYARDLALFSLPIWKDQKQLAFTWNGWLYTCIGLFEASLPSVLCRNIYSDKIWVVWTSYTTSHRSGGWARSGVHAGGTGKTQAWQSMSVTVGDNLGTSRNTKYLVIQVGQGKVTTSLRQITASYLSTWKKETDSMSRNVFQPRYWVTSESLLWVKTEAGSQGCNTSNSATWVRWSGKPYAVGGVSVGKRPSITRR